MKKAVKRFSIIMVLSVFLCSNSAMQVSAQEKMDGVSHQVYFRILDKDGNLKTSGYLPSSEDTLSEMQRGTAEWPARTLGNGEVMECFRSGDSGFEVNRGDHVSMQFGLNRNTYIYSGIGKWNGIETIAVSDGLTGGRHHGGPAPSYGYYYGFIRNASTADVTVTYANFYTPYL